MDVLLDSTLIYVLLVLGLWVTATAIYIPGTGIPEVIGGIFLVVSAVALFSMPTNWISATVLILGVAIFVVIPLALPRYAAFADLGLLLQGLGGFFLFQKTPPSWIVILLSLAIGFAYNRFVLMPLLKRMQDEPGVGEELKDIVGAEGRVVAAVIPPHAGTAQINSELWTIRSEDALEYGDIVQVVEVDGLQLSVVAVKRKRTQDVVSVNGAQPETTLQ